MVAVIILICIVIIISSRPSISISIIITVLTFSLAYMAVKRSIPFMFVKTMTGLIKL